MKELKKLFLISFIAFAGILTGYSQDNVVKLGPAGLFVGNIRTGYERVISDNQSITLNIGVLIPREFPGFVNLDSELDDIKSKMTSFSVSSEYRFYPGKNDAPKGFYLAPYLRFNTYLIKFNQVYDGSEVTVDNRVSNFGGGLQLGYQWVISELVTIDFYFLGLGVDNNIYTTKLTSDDLGVDYAALEDDIREEIEDIPYISDKFEIESGDDYLKGKTSIISPGLRAGLSIGIAF